MAPLLQFVVVPDGPTKPSSILVVSALFLAICVIAVALRFNIRRIQKVPLKMDDWIMLPALILIMGMDICAFIGVSKHKWGYNMPADYGPVIDAYEGKLLTAFTYIQIPALVCVKYGALAFYGRVFGDKSKSNMKFDITRKVTYIIVGLWGLAMILMNTFQCGIHVDSLWNANFDTYCTREPAYIEGSAISNAILDAWILILPLPKIWNLHTTTARKVAISGVFLIAIIGLAASLARMVATIQIANEVFAEDADYFLEDALLVFWSNLEIGVSMLAVNMPSLWAYRSKISPEGVIASIRSAISLSSLRSNLSASRSNRMVPLSGGEDQDLSIHSTLSKSNVVPAGPGKSEGFAMYDVNAQNVPPGEGVIVVKSSVLQDHSEVQEGDK